MQLQKMRGSVLAAVLITLFGCVDVTKSGSAFPPTSASKVELLLENPARPYKVVAKLSTSSWWTFQADAMHEAMKKKAAEVGADAIVIDAEGVRTIGLGSYERYAQADAIKYVTANAVVP